MIKAFWTWNPVCSGEFRRFDEPYMFLHNEWLFDRELWQKMFRAMSDFGFNAMFFANTHPFPFMIEYDRFTEAAMLDSAELARYREAYNWIFHESKAYGIDTYLLFFSIYYPEPMLDSLGVYDRAAYAASDLAIDYTRYCVEQTLKTYLDLAGIVGEASENISGSRSVFLRQAIVEPFEELTPEKKLILRGWWSGKEELIRDVRDRSKIPITFSVKYTWEHFIHHNPDPLFTEWASAAGPENVMAELWISNIEPFICYAHSTVKDIVDNLCKSNNQGFSLHPLSVYEWPRTLDRCWQYQFDRDAAWYQAWGGSGDIPEDQQALFNDDMRESLEAASRVLMTSALYFAGDRQNQWRPQFASVRHADCVRLLTIEDMCNLSNIRSFWSGGMWQPFDCLDWRTTFTGQPTMHFEDYDPNNTEAYGPVQFAEEMERLADSALSSIGRSEERYHSPTQRCLLSQTKAQALLGIFWAERARAALSHLEGNRTYAIKHMEKALDSYKQVEMIETSHRSGFRTLTGRCVHANNWDLPRQALEQELADYIADKPLGIYRSGITEHRDTSYHPRGMFSWRR